MMRPTLFFATAMLASAGWCDTTFDAGSGNAQTSIDAMKAEMADAEKAEFDAAIRVIDVAINSIMWEVQLDETDSALAKLVRIFLHGKTASEFVDTAERACGVVQPNEFMVRMVCEEMSEAAANAARSDPTRAVQHQEETRQVSDPEEPPS